jgi:hypothetical protein
MLRYDAGALNSLHGERVAMLSVVSLMMSPSFAYGACFLVCALIKLARMDAKLLGHPQNADGFFRLDQCGQM